TRPMSQPRQKMPDRLVIVDDEQPLFRTRHIFIYCKAYASRKRLSNSDLTNDSAVLPSFRSRPTVPALVQTLNAAGLRRDEHPKPEGGDAVVSDGATATSAHRRRRSVLPRLRRRAHSPPRLLGRCR